MREYVNATVPAKRERWTELSVSDTNGTRENERCEHGSYKRDGDTSPSRDVLAFF